MTELSIGDVAERTGIATSAIRFYEAEGLISPAPRRGNRRIFSERVLDELALIDLAKNAGFSVAEIRQLLRGFESDEPPSERWRAMTAAKMTQLEARISEARQMQAVLARVMKCRCPSLEDCGNVVRQKRRAKRGSADRKLEA